MQKTRTWQESFDRLEAARRKERQLPDAEARKIHDAEAAYATAAASETEKPAAPVLMLVSARPEAEVLLVKPRGKPKTVAKPARPKTAPRKRVATKSKSKTVKARAARPRKAYIPQVAAVSPAIALPDEPQTAPDALLPITPLPRSAALTPYRKVGLFGLIGSWLRIARRQAASGLAGGMKAKPRPPIDELAELRAENERLRRQLDALLASPQTRARANRGHSAKIE